METKKDYNIGDPVWIYGIDRTNKRLTKGMVIFKLSIPGYTETHYIISIPTEIEPLLEIRTWESMSQDATGPVGLFRKTSEDFPATVRFISKLGFNESEEFDDEPTAEEIHAAIEKSKLAASHPPLIIKEPKPKRKFYRKK